LLATATPQALPSLATMENVMSESTGSASCRGRLMAADE
jgi:hypothetical protein